MCGLILAGPGHPQDRVEKAMASMSYRGFEGRHGLISWKGWTIGHVRLAIQDLTEAAAQPVIEPGQVFAFVGELFDTDRPEREAMSRALKGFNFHNLDGFWSVVRITKAGVYALTDYLGSKPLYWWPEENIVCSEIRPMFELADKPELDQVYLSNVAKWGYDYSGRTPWVGIRQIAPGTILNVLEKVSKPYWDWSGVEGSPDEIRLEVDKAIANRTISDRPVSMLLSGGLDSSIVYYSLKAMGKPVRPFSIENGESNYLPFGVKTLDLPAVETTEALRVMQAPLDLGSLVPQVRLARAISGQGYNVCLTGDGADELFGGYRRAKEYDSQGSDVFCELPYYHFPRLDRVMMSETIELRSPFIAPRVIAAALRTPYHMRTEKQALKEAYRGLVPDKILERAKHPLKTEAVISGGISYRCRLIKEFTDVQASF